MFKYKIEITNMRKYRHFIRSYSREMNETFQFPKIRKLPCDKLYLSIKDIWKKINVPLIYK